MTSRRVWFALAVLMVVGGGGAALRLHRRGRGLVDTLGATSTVWQPRPAMVPDGGCPAVVDDRASAGAATTADADAGVGGPVRFAVVGDYGQAGPNEQAVADLVTGWKPAFIITTGDNNYPLGEASTIDLNIGLFYHDYIAPYAGHFGCGASTNRFFPSLGNHDWYTANAGPYLDYFTLPGNERYYDVVWGGVQVFALDSDANEPDGVTQDSAQASWLHQRLSASTAHWRVVYMHHPPYSSGPHGSTLELRWPFKAWGADLVVSGHDHIYERLQVDGLTYIVDGLGGAPTYEIGAPIAGSQARFAAAGGALFVEADAASLHVTFRTTDGKTIDETRVEKP